MKKHKQKKRKKMEIQKNKHVFSKCEIINFKSAMQICDYNRVKKNLI